MRHSCTLLRYLTFKLLVDKSIIWSYFLTPVSTSNPDSHVVLKKSQSCTRSMVGVGVMEVFVRASIVTAEGGRTPIADSNIQPPIAQTMRM